MGGRGSKGGAGPGTGSSGRRSGPGAPGGAAGLSGGSGGGGSAGSSGGGGKGPTGAGTGGVTGGGGGSGSGGGGSVTTPEPNQPTGKKQFSNAAEARKWFSDIWPSSDDYGFLIRGEYRKYSTNKGYQTINTALRDVGGDASKFNDQSVLDNLKDYEGNPYSDSVKQKYINDLADRITKMDQAMADAPEMPQAVDLARGTRWHEFAGLGITGEDDDLTKLIGKSYVNDSYTSTSVGGKAAMSYMPVQVSISVPKGMKGVYMAGDEIHDGALSSLPDENEFLLPRGTKFKIKSVTKDANGNWIMEVEAIKP